MWHVQAFDVAVHKFGIGVENTSHTRKPQILIAALQNSDLGSKTLGQLISIVELVTLNLANFADSGTLLTYSHRQQHPSAAITVINR